MFFTKGFVFLLKLDGQTLPINRRQKAYNNGTLIIEQLQRMEDAGTYTCMAQNKQKQSSRRNVEIQVLSKLFSFYLYLLLLHLIVDLIKNNNYVNYNSKHKKVPPKIMPIQSMTNMLKEGMRAAISCQILEGDLPVTFRWERNGKPLRGTG